MALVVVSASLVVALAVGLTSMTSTEAGQYRDEDTVGSVQATQIIADIKQSASGSESRFRTRLTDTIRQLFTIKRSVPQMPPAEATKIKQQMQEAIEAVQARTKEEAELSELTRQPNAKQDALLHDKVVNVLANATDPTNMDEPDT